jgi:hypothetical protein
MKTQIVLLFTVILLSIGSCSKEDAGISINKNASNVELKGSAGDYLEATSNPSASISDPFELGSIVINNGTVEVTVSYPGGCKTHTFDIIWDESVNYTYPPSINIVIIHDDNGDSCEAYITEVLRFQLDSLIGNKGTDNFVIGGFSGWDTSDSAVYEAPKYEFGFQESNDCILTVTAREAMCGWGLYGGTWFALEDSISAGIPDFYYGKFLQPVSVADNLKEFKPVVGKKYSIGARIDTTKYNFSDQPVCLAYPGPSVPVKIMCISEVK